MTVGYMSDRVVVVLMHRREQADRNTPVGSAAHPYEGLGRRARARDPKRRIRAFLPA